MVLHASMTSGYKLTPPQPKSLNTAGCKTTAAGGEKLEGYYTDFVSNTDNSGVVVGTCPGQAQRGLIPAQPMVGDRRPRNTAARFGIRHDCRICLSTWMVVDRSTVRFDSAGDGLIDCLVRGNCPRGVASILGR